MFFISYSKTISFTNCERFKTVKTDWHNFKSFGFFYITNKEKQLVRSKVAFIKKQFFWVVKNYDDFYDVILNNNYINLLKCKTTRKLSLKIKIFNNFFVCIDFLY